MLLYSYQANQQKFVLYSAAISVLLTEACLHGRDAY